MTLPESRTLTAHGGEVPYYSFPAFDRVPFVRHGFSTRLGGVSAGKFASMNLSFTRGDDDAAVRENFRRQEGRLGASSAARPGYSVCSVAWINWGPSWGRGSASQVE